MYHLSYWCGVITAFLALSATAHAQVWDSPWNSTTTSPGSFSQADQLLAGEFKLSTTAGVNRATWQGTMNDPDPLNTGDTWTFDLHFWNDGATTPGTLLAKRTVVADVTDTGLDTGSDRSYLFDASFPAVTLFGSAEYWFTAENTGNQDTFQWTEETGITASAVAKFENSNWNPLPQPNNLPLNYQLFAEAEGPQGASAVPEPTAFGLLSLGAIGLAACDWRRRRRLAALR